MASIGIGYFGVMVHRIKKGLWFHVEQLRDMKIGSHEYAFISRVGVLSSFA